MSKIQVGGGTAAMQQSEAIPDSKVHADPQPPAYNWSAFTINGQPIPEALWPNMNYHLTDQAAAERAAKVGPRPFTTVLRDEADKRGLDEYRDGMKTSRIRGADPLEIAMRKHLPPGMHGLWIGAKKAEEAGLVRGGLEYVPLMIDDPDHPGKKKKVMQNGMMLAVVSEADWQDEQRYLESVNDEKQRHAVERVQEQSDKLLDATGMNELAKRKRIDRALVSGAIEVDDSEQADRELESMGAHEVGSD
jgi:hypothetical protein